MYLALLASTYSGGNLSLQYVHTMNLDEDVFIQLVGRQDRLSINRRIQSKRTTTD